MSLLRDMSISKTRNTKSRLLSIARTAKYQMLRSDSLISSQRVLADRDHSLLPDGLADHGERLLPDFAIPHDVVRIVQVQLVYLFSRHELIDFDRNKSSSPN
jgi:hypothetical protein